MDLCGTVTDLFFLLKRFPQRKAVVVVKWLSMGNQYQQLCFHFPLLESRERPASCRNTIGDYQFTIAFCLFGCQYGMPS